MAGRAGEAGAWYHGWLTVVCEPSSSWLAGQVRLMVGSQGLLTLNMKVLSIRACRLLN